MTAYVRDTQFFTTRTTVLAAIIALHLFIAWALATGLARKAIEVLAPPIQTDIVQEEKTKVEPPPPPPPEMQKQVVEVPPPDINIAMPEVGPSTNAITATAVQHAAPPAPAPRAVSRTAMVIDTKHFPNSEDFYPQASKRLGEQGSPVVKICLGADGKLAAGSPSIATSSGSPRLDEGALLLVKAGARYITPAKEDGRPVAACQDLRIKFELH
jgi:periplasmic protein TonB